MGRRNEPAPLGPTQAAVVDRYGKPAGVENLFLGYHVFLVLGGPSLNELPLEKLRQRGVVTFAVNNVAAHPRIRPSLWTYGDTPWKFHNAIWADGGVMKFSPQPKDGSKLYCKRGGGFIELTKRAGDMPNVLGVRRNATFRPDKWLYEDTVNWGQGQAGLRHYMTPWLIEHDGMPPNEHRKRVDKRIKAVLESGKLSWEQYEEIVVVPKILSTMVQAMRLCFYLGFRFVYLLGCDFAMGPEQRYAFAENRTEGAINSNNHAYRTMERLWGLMRPRFDEAGFHVLNCNQKSSLTAFNFLPFEEALANSRRDMPDEIDTVGWYEKVGK